MTESRPNILFILSDQHRYDCVGASGVYPVRTPNIDALAEGGIRFEQAYTPTPICCPARQALLHGRRPESFGALWNFDNALPTGHLQDGAYSWAAELREHGYRTGHVGKWHIHPKLGPESFGFDDCCPDEDYRRYRMEKYPNVKFTNGFWGEIDPVELDDAHTHWSARKAGELIRKYTAEGAPWHIRLDFHEPHLPCRPVLEFAQRFAPEQIPTWPSFSDRFEGKPYIQKQQLYSWGVESFTWPDWAPIVARYYAVIAQMDDAVGRVLRVLDELGIADNTIVVYTADHGDMCGAHRMVDKHYVLYDDVVRVPLIIRWPAQIAAGSTCDHFVYQALDLPPTLLEASGRTPQPFFHGRSLIPILDGNAPADWRTAVVSTYNGQQFGLYTQRMIRTKEYKYVWNLTDIDELYAMKDDPHELRNRIDDPAYCDIVGQLRKRLHGELAAVKDGLINSFTEKQLLENRKLPC